MPGIEIENEFTSEEWERIRTHHKPHGMAFEVFLPESCAKWLRAKLAAGVFKDAAEAVVGALQDLQGLDHHPWVHQQLLKVTLKERASDPQPGVPLEPMHAEPQDRLRERAHSAPGKQRRHRTGRNQQINIKATPQVIERLNKLADAKRIPLGELLEQALDALEKSAGGLE